MSTRLLFVQWLFTNVIAALLPVAVSLCILRFGKITATWHAVLKDGELFIFSSTLSMTALATSHFSDVPHTLPHLIATYFLFGVLVLSTAAYGFAIYCKLAGVDSHGEGIAKTSIMASGSTIILSSYLFFVSGGV
ncbi:MAG TPA: hypothetical protein VK399_01425 [Longimicrobiaceae bacterium]|nr:hypothetical protein [Longimicrobiaceae bacterium]